MIMLVATLLTIEAPTTREFEHARWCAIIKDTNIKQAHERYCAHLKEKIRIWQERK